MAKKLFGVVLILLLALVAILPGCSGEEGPQVGKTAPDFKLLGLDGKTVSLRDFRGQPVMLNFWASWCGPCRYEMPFFEQIHAEWSGKGLVILAVNIGENVTTVREFIDESGFTFPILLDSNQNVTLRYNVRSIPTTFFLDRSGVIQDVKVGAFISEESAVDKLAKIMR